MHDPLVVAFEIKRPWPHRYKARTVDGRDLPAHHYWPALVRVWHREPNGRDSGEVCKHYHRYQDSDGKWQYKFHHGWKFHIHHWHLQIPPLQHLRRRLLTRCAWCGGQSRKGDAVNVSHSWDGPRGHWWQGEPGLYHHDCAAIYRAHDTCVCEQPVLEYDGWGRCARCNNRRSYGMTAENLTRTRELSTIPAGARHA